MIISIIQPCFVPWLGYFEQIAIADVFVYMDDVLYTKKDWRNGNQLKSQYGVKDISFPVKKAPHNTLIKDIEISYNTNWEDTLINQLFNWYKKAPFYKEIVDLITPVIYKKYDRLVDLNYNVNNVILNYLDITTPIFFSSDIERKTDDKTDRIIEICKNFEDVTILYDGKKAQNFLDVDYMRKHGIKVIFQDYQHIPYTQLWGDFEPYMSIIDLIMNYGKDANKRIVNHHLSDKLIKFKQS